MLNCLSSLLQVSVAIGCAVRDRNVVFASTFATFFTRAYDQLRMAAISESNINLCGSHCGVSIGQLPSSLLCYVFTVVKSAQRLVYYHFTPHS